MGFMEDCTESEKQNGCLGAEQLLASRSHGWLGAAVSTGCVWLSHHRNVEKPLNWTIKSWETSIEGCCRTWEEGGRNNHSLAGKYVSGSDSEQGPASGNVQLLRAHAGLMTCCCVLKVFILFEQGALHFYFALSLTNYVANPAAELNTSPRNKRKGQ